MYNLDLIEARLALVTRYLDRLEGLGAVPVGQFVADDTRAAAAESYLRRALEALFDVGRHLLAKGGFTELAGEYKGIARGLTTLSAVSPALGEDLVKMAGYRNRLVHLYNEVTNAELHAILQANLGTVREAARAIRAYVATRS
jgi:uncharacterized protein YutE (UPF0331/DUF86 family)